ncbi:MAG: hypothetical protein EZS28_013505 [Streblomastix strix]|uniref:Uncharacterized protein n=1 Tax=Streblomastix strix TaxID=222440 RepID=A0A5J4W9E0_9EUKA|nr:MAG: hypothetical protein EZS28_013505 [Streblomastix strix]
MLRQSSDDRKLAVKLNNKYEDANEARLHWTSDEIPQTRLIKRWGEYFDMNGDTKDLHRQGQPVSLYQHHKIKNEYKPTLEPSQQQVSDQDQPVQPYRVLIQKIHTQLLMKLFSLTRIHELLKIDYLPRLELCNAMVA